MTAGTVREWIQKGCPYVERSSGRGGTWVLETAAIHEWLVEQELIRAGLGGDDEDGEPRVVILTPSQRKQEADAGIRELELAKRLGEVVLIDVALGAYASRLDRIQSRLNVVATRSAPLVAAEKDPKKCQRIINKVMNEVRDELVGFTKGEVAAGGTKPPVRDAGSTSAGATA